MTAHQRESSSSPTSRTARRAAAAVALAASLALTSCAATGGAAGDDAATELTIGTVVDVESFDPATLASSGDWPQIWGAVYDTLLKLEPDGSVSENLATDWEYSDGNTTLTLTLRDDVTFTDGTPFDAEAVKANIEHFQAGTGAAHYTADAIESVEVIDVDEVALHLSTPDPVLERSLALPLGAMASPAALETDEIALSPVGSGPYVLDEDASAKGAQYVFERNEDYWNPAEFPFDSLTIRVLSDVNARLNALVSGQIDAGRITPALAEQAEAQGLTVYNNPVDWVGLIILDREGELVPALGDVRVRQAINMVFDRPALLESLGLGMGSVTEQIVGIDSVAYDESLNDTYGHDIEAAKALMAEAGYADGFSVKMIDRDRYAQYMPYVEQALGELGITIEWVSLAEDVATADSFSGDFPMLIIANSAPVNSYEALNFAYGSTWNVFDNHDPEFDALMEKARTSSGAEQEEAYRAANAWLVENAWFVPWYYSDIVYATSSDVTVEVQSGDAGPQLRSFSPTE
jgi:peptide/nickel transport system substrate-binding protein